MKTSNDILSDIYKLVKSSPIDALNGGIFKGTRTTDSNLQDCVVSLISGQTAKFLQNGAVYVKIFFADLFLDNTYSQDYVISSQMERLLFDLSNTLLNTKGYSFDIQSREIYSEPVQSQYGGDRTNEHYSILKINFKSLL